MVWRWLKAYWYVPLTVAGAVLAIVFGSELQRRASPRAAVKRVARELKAIEAQKTMSAVVAEKGRDYALATIKKAHQRDLASLDSRQVAKADRLRKDPAALSKFLVRIASDS